MAPSVVPQPSNDANFDIEQPTTPETLTPTSSMSMAQTPPPSPAISALPTELWFLVINNLDLPSLEKALSVFRSLRSQCIQPGIRPDLLPSLLQWLDATRGTDEVMTKLPFEVLDTIFQLLEPADKVNMAVGLWRKGVGGGSVVGEGSSSVGQGPPYPQH